MWQPALKAAKRVKSVMSVRLAHLPLMKKCNGSICNENCSSYCEKTQCNIGRKHSRGVCCMTCYELCDKCGGSFYVEYLNFYNANDPEYEQYEWLCHCCCIDLGFEYSEWKDPLLNLFYNSEIEIID